MAMNGLHCEATPKHTNLCPAECQSTPSATNPVIKTQFTSGPEPITPWTGPKPIKGHLT